MRKIILGLAVSLDRFIEGPNGEYDWCFTDEDYGMTDFMKQIDSIFMGIKSYELASSLEGENPWSGIKTYVFSNTLKQVPDNMQLVSGDIASEVMKIKHAPGKDIWLFGGASLTSSLLNSGLVDELWLSIHPILLGSGKPLFQGVTGRIKTKLLDTKTYSSGLVSLKYEVLNQ